MRNYRIMGLVSALLLMLLVSAAYLSVEESEGDACYAVTFEGNTGKTSLPYAYPEETYSTKLPSIRGYDYPESIAVTVGGREFTDFTYAAWIGSVKIDAGKINGDVVLKGNHLPKVFTVTLIPNVNNGSSSFKIVFGSDTLLNYKAPVKQDAIFTGYWTMNEGVGGAMVVNPDGTLVSDVAGYTKGGKWDNDSNCTLYGRWTAVEMTGNIITYHANGGQFVGGSETVYGFQTLSFDASKLPKASWGRFLGWAETADATIPKYIPTVAKIEFAAPTHLYAVWERTEPISSDATTTIPTEIVLPVLTLIIISVMMIVAIGWKADRGGL